MSEETLNTEAQNNGATPETAQNSKASASASATASASSTTDGTTALNTKINELESSVKDKESRYLYLYAEFENYKRRAQKEKEDAIKFGWEKVARDLLQVIDNLERAVEHAPQATDKPLMDGLLMVVKQFRTQLEKQGVQTIETVGKDFDPNLHEAVAQEPSDSIAEGKISKEQLKGYTLHGRLLRPAMVTISLGKG